MAESLSANLDPAIAAKYNATKASLEFSNLRAQELAKEAIGTTNANYNYNRSVALRAEPLKLRANMNAANTAGLAESGQLARTQGQTQTQFAQKQARLGELRNQAVNKIRTGLTSSETANALKQNEAVATANAEQQKYLLENPPPPTAPAAVPGTAAATRQKAAANIKVPPEWGAKYKVRKLGAPWGGSVG